MPGQPRVLRLNENVEPHFGRRRVVPAFEKQEHSVKRINKTTAPYVADEPSGSTHVVRGSRACGQFIYHAAAIAESTGTHKHLAELTCGDASDGWLES